MAASRILHLHFGKEGGAERFFVTLAQALAERGMEQRFIIRPGRSWRNEVGALGLVIESDYHRLSLASAFLAWRVRRLVHRWKPHVIMAWMSRSSRLVPDDANAVKLTRLGDYPRHLKNFRHDDYLIGNAPGVIDHVRQLGWTKPAVMISNFPREVVPVPVDRDRLQTPRDAFVICGSGRFAEGKCFEMLIKTAAALPGTWLWLVGDGPTRPALESLVDEAGIRDRTRFTGWVDEPTHYVAASDVYCMASRFEPLGNVILEAWHARVPVVTTRSAGPSWFVSDGEDALMIDIGDTAAMTAAVDRIRRDPLLRARLIENGCRTLAARFTKDRVVESYVDVFERRVA